MATVAEDTVFGIIRDQLNEEHVLCVKSDCSLVNPQLCFTAVNTKLAQTLQCQVNSEESGITLPAIKTALVGGKIQLDSVLREISVTLIGQSLSQKMDVLSGNIQNKEIGLLLFAMIKRITKLEQTMSKSTVNNLKEPTFFSAKKNRVSKSRKRTQSMMNLKKPANIHLRGIQYASSTESE